MPKFDKISYFGRNPLCSLRFFQNLIFWQKSFVFFEIFFSKFGQICKKNKFALKFSSKIAEISKFLESALKFSSKFIQIFKILIFLEIFVKISSKFAQKIVQICQKCQNLAKTCFSNLAMRHANGAWRAQSGTLRTKVRL